MKQLFSDIGQQEARTVIPEWRETHQVSSTSNIPFYCLQIVSRLKQREETQMDSGFLPEWRK